MRQIGVVAHMYLNDHNDLLPIQYRGDITNRTFRLGDTTEPTWSENLGPYLDMDPDYLYDIMSGAKDATEPLGVFTSPKISRSYPLDSGQSWGIPIDFGAPNTMWKEDDDNLPPGVGTGDDVLSTGRLHDLRGSEAVLLHENHCTNIGGIFSGDAFGFTGFRDIGNRAFTDWPDAPSDNARGINQSYALDRNVDMEMNFLRVGGDVQTWHVREFGRDNSYLDYSGRGDKRKYLDNVWGSSWSGVE